MCDSIPLTKPADFFEKQVFRNDCDKVSLSGQVHFRLGKLSFSDDNL